MDNKSKYLKTSISILIAIQLILILLKVINILPVSWLWIMSPFWLFGAFLGLIGIGCIVVLVIITIVERLDTIFDK